jgi:hypothetical protein
LVYFFPFGYFVPRKVWQPWFGQKEGFDKKIGHKQKREKKSCTEVKILLVRKAKWCPPTYDHVHDGLRGGFARTVTRLRDALARTVTRLNEVWPFGRFFK